MKKYLLSIILGLLITSVASARSTGCKEGNCEKMVKELKLGQMDTFIKVNLKIVYGVEQAF